MKDKIGILDYGVGNIGSIASMLARIGYEAQVIENAQSLHEVDRLIIPGVGSFDYAMNQLKTHHFDDQLKSRCVAGELKILGICLGMQLLFSESEEGVCPGLGLVPGSVRRIVSNDHAIKVPHMGWQFLNIKSPSILFPIVGTRQKFYFVHSYHCVPNDYSIVTSTVSHGINIVSSISYGNIHGVQFHPEKSHKYGLAVLKNFCSTS